MKTRSNIYLLIAVLCLCAVLAVGTVEGDTTGPTPLYDSGWIDCPGYGETTSFNHALNSCPTLWMVFAGGDSESRNPTQSPTVHYRYYNQDFYGHLVTEIAPTLFKIKWLEWVGQYGGNWYEADDSDTHVRLVIFAADTELGCPIRP